MIKSNELSQKPVGIFDSGIGGLTVVKEVKKVLPKETIIYFGDTARVPYGTKSKETITRFAVEDANFLIQKGVKAIVVACNSVSSNSLDYLKAHYSIPILGVIEPGVFHACKETENKKVGIIGTAATIESGTYEKQIKMKCPEIAVYSKSCPLFVPLAEEGWLDRQATLLIAQEYLQDLINNGIDTLVLGCTHYPLLKRIIRRVTGEEIFLIDSAYYTALALKALLQENDILNHRSEEEKIEFYLSDIPRGFSEVGERFLGSKIEGVTVVDISG
jgi:glutamate racemase